MTRFMAMGLTVCYLFVACGATADEGEEAKTIKALEKFGGSVWYPKKHSDYTLVAFYTPRMSAAGLKEAVVYLRQLPNLRALSLSYTQMGDSGLGCLKELPGLEALFLKLTRVTDAGLPHLHKMSGLREIDLTLTRVTDKGVAALKKALPRAKITYSGAGKPAAETEKLRGTWREELERDGDKGSKHEFLLFIAGNDMSLGGVVIDRFTLHPDSKPKGIDMEFADCIPGYNSGPENNLGIYRLEGDTLTLCMGHGVRPREFSPKPKGVSLYKFKRVKE